MREWRGGGGSFDASLQNCDLNLTSESFPQCGNGTTKVAT